MRHSSQPARCRTDGPRRWRSWFVGANDMGRWPMLGLDGPLALESDARWCWGKLGGHNSWGVAPGNVSENRVRAESPPHQIAMRHSSQHARCRTDGPRRWRSWFVRADDMGRWPMLVWDGPLALTSDTPLALASAAPLALGENWVGTVPRAWPQAGMNRAVGPSFAPCHNH